MELLVDSESFVDSWILFMANITVNLNFEVFQHWRFKPAT